MKETSRKQIYNKRHADISSSHHHLPSPCHSRCLLHIIDLSFHSANWKQYNFKKLKPFEHIDIVAFGILSPVRVRNNIAVLLCAQSKAPFHCYLDILLSQVANECNPSVQSWKRPHFVPDKISHVQI